MADPVWAAFRARWAGLKPPLRPDADVVAGLAAAVAGRDARVLLLGVTPELAGIGRDLTAIDHDPGMIAHVWPGDTPRARAIRADWRTMAPGSGFDAAIGDGCLNVLATADDVRAVFARLGAALAPGGVVAVRAYTAPDVRETAEAVRDAALAGTAPFHAFKWRLAMAVADEDGGVALADVHAAFEALFPDRAALAVASGWRAATIAEIDHYRGSAGRFAFPTRKRWRAMVPEPFAPPRFVACGRYPLAERCPLLVTTRL